MDYESLFVREWLTANNEFDCISITVMLVREFGARYDSLLSALLYNFALLFVGAEQIHGYSTELVIVNKIKTK